MTGKADAQDAPPPPDWESPRPTGPERREQRLPDDVARLLELVGNRVQRAGLLTQAWPDETALLASLSRLSETPLNGALGDEERLLCRMALREAQLRLTAWPRQETALELIYKVYVWLGGSTNPA